MTSHELHPGADDRVTMTFEERNAWLSLILIPATSIAYFAVVFPRLFSQPASEVAWIAPMLWAIGASIVGTILGSIVWAIVARDGKGESDIRDKQIERYGDRLAQAITAFGSAGVLVLVMVETDYFWIGNALYLIGAIGATLGSIARIRAYRGSFNG